MYHPWSSLTDGGLYDELSITDLAVCADGAQVDGRIQHQGRVNGEIVPTRSKIN